MKKMILCWFIGLIINTLNSNCQAQAPSVSDSIWQIVQKIERTYLDSLQKFKEKKTSARKKIIVGYRLTPFKEKFYWEKKRYYKNGSVLTKLRVYRRWYKTSKTILLELITLNRQIIQLNYTPENFTNHFKVRNNRLFSSKKYQDLP